MKPVYFLFSLFLLFSCKNTGSQQPGTDSRHQLVPYASRYHNTVVKDTLLIDNVYVKYLVSADTSDATLYIRYGKPGFDSVFKQAGGLPGGCDTWEYVYQTPHAIALMYECFGDRRLLLLPLNATGNIRFFSPLFVGTDDSLLLVKDDKNTGSRPRALIAADLDFNQQKTFQLSYNIPCDDMLACFDTIYFRKKLILQYETRGESTEPVTRIQEETLHWKQ